MEVLSSVDDCYRKSCVLSGGPAPVAAWQDTQVKASCTRILLPFLFLPLLLVFFLVLALREGDLFLKPAATKPNKIGR